MSKNHAKFLLVRNASWNVVVRTSMNLNENRRFETVELSDDAGLAAFLEGFVDEVFAHHAVGGTKRKPGEAMAEFSRFAARSSTRSRPTSRS